MNARIHFALNEAASIRRMLYHARKYGGAHQLMDEQFVLIRHSNLIQFVREARI